MTIWRLSLGDFEESEIHNGDGERLIFLFGSFILALTMLNLLIALMGDIYEKVQSTMSITDARERLLLIQEVAKFKQICSRNPVLVYMHFCTTDML